MPQQHIQAKLANLRQHLMPLLQSTNELDAGGLLTLNTVIDRLGIYEDIDLQAHKENPLSDLLPQIQHASRSLFEPCQNMVNSIIDFAGALPWYQRPVANNPEFMAGHVNAQIIGPDGLEVRHDLIVGVTLMRPNIDYPDHQHEPEELYLVLSEGYWRQNNTPWHTPGLGGLVYNPSNVFHGMKSLSTPLIALWCLPLDQPFTSFSSALSNSSPTT
ncbi:MAG: hypothetical protein ACI9EP_001585 [Oceanospirillaceae bacterium]|jgi:hypothetical protein